MARRISDKPTLSNPTILGENMETVLVQALGLGVTAFVNDKVAAPFLSNVVPASSGVMAKAVDAVTTGLAAWIVGEGVGIVDKSVGRLMKHGGFILAGGKLISVLVPSFSISANIPNLLPAATPVKALPAGNGSAAMAAAANQRSAVRSSGL